MDVYLALKIHDDVNLEVLVRSNRLTINSNLCKVKCVIYFNSEST